MLYSNASDSLVKDVVWNGSPILDEVARRLDNSSFRDGQLCCWKQLAGYFKVPDKVYYNLKQGDNPSQSENLFQYLASTQTDLTIGKIKEALGEIGKQDLVDKITSELEGMHSSFILFKKLRIINRV